MVASYQGPPAAERLKQVGIGTARLPGTCGELVQGSLNGVPFHISCPVDIFATVVARAFASGTGVQGPVDRPKAIQAAEATLKYLGAPKVAILLEVENPLPVGKGMASSTADVGGAVWATALSLGVRLPPHEVARIALSIEPTDGSLFPGIALFDHRQGRIYEHLGVPPPMEILVLEFGGTVDTIEFNREDRSTLLKKIEPDIRRATALVREGIARQDAALIGEGATISARCNQRILFKPHLEDVLKIARENGAEGVNIAHSGTVVGILLDSSKKEAYELIGAITRKLPNLERIYPCRLVSGGF